MCWLRGRRGTFDARMNQLQREKIELMHHKGNTYWGMVRSRVVQCTMYNVEFYVFMFGYSFKNSISDIEETHFSVSGGAHTNLIY